MEYKNSLSNKLLRIVRRELNLLIIMSPYTVFAKDLIKIQKDFYMLSSIGYLFLISSKL